MWKSRGKPPKTIALQGAIGDLLWHTITWRNQYAPIQIVPRGTICRASEGDIEINVKVRRWKSENAEWAKLFHAEKFA